MMRSFERSLSVRKPSRVEASDVAGVQPTALASARRSPRDCPSSPASRSVRAPEPRRFRRLAAAASPGSSATRTSMPVCATPTEAEHAHRRQRERIGEQRAIHRGDRHRRFALTVDLREPRAERREGRAAIGDVHRTAAEHDAFRCRSRRVSDLRSGEQALHHRRRGEEKARSHARSRSQISARIETAGFGYHVDRSGEDVRHHVESRAVRQRRRMQDRVARRDRLDVAQKARAHRPQVAVRDHHSLGRPVVPLV